MVEYYDWNNALPILGKAYQLKIPAILIGSSGVGKTELCQALSKHVDVPLSTISYSLRTRESHLIGSKTLEGGDVKWVDGALTDAYRTGKISYHDELNTAEADVTVRVDESMDDRRQISLKEWTGEIIHAHKNWWAIASINPISHAGTKELSPQLLSRFPIRIYMTYPPTDIEQEIVRRHTDVIDDEVVRAIELANRLRKRAIAGDILYCPGMRETITFARMIGNGLTPANIARVVFKNAYYQWGETEAQKIEDAIRSLWSGQ